MKFNAQLYLKWLDANNAALGDFNFAVVNLCTLIATSEEGHIAGATVFEAKDFNREFVERFNKRRAKPELIKQRFTLYLPHFLKQRANDTLAEELKQGLNVVYTPFLYLKRNGNNMTIRERIRIASVDDSPVILKLLKRTMDELAFVEVVGQTTDPLKALEMIRLCRPDMITLDIQMPRLTGVELLKQILEVSYYPVIMISGLNLEEGSLVFEALNNGAFEYIQKPDLNKLKEFRESLSTKLLLGTYAKNTAQALAPRLKSVSTAQQPTQKFSENLLWAIGSSTGGTQALTRILTSLPAHIPPCLIVQHIPPVYSKAFADLLNDLCPFTVKEAQNGDIVEADHVYISPGGIHMGVEKKLGRLQIKLWDTAPVNRFKPSVDFLFSELAQVTGFSIIAGILTGMGKDGGQGLLALKKAGAWTFAQDEQSSVVYGMPRYAVEIGATSTSLPLDTIAQNLLNQSQVRP